MLGSAAGIHLSAHSGRVAIIGPDEPANRYDRHPVYGSHYDEGRITRMLDPDPVWARLAQRSILAYEKLQAQTGISFFREVGHLYVSDQTGDPDSRLSRVRHNADDMGVSCQTLDQADLEQEFPYLHFAQNALGLYQRRLAGHLSPRAFVQASTHQAAQQGAQIIRETVAEISPNQAGKQVQIRTLSGRHYTASKVLLASGSFSNCYQLLDRPLDLRVYARTVLLARLEADRVHQLAGMPSIIYNHSGMPDGYYLLPPVLYPDGHWYLKIGDNWRVKQLHTLADLQRWFQSRGSLTHAVRLQSALAMIMPALKPAELKTDSCVTSYTASGQVYADWLLPGRVAILAGGNGQAAKSALEIGRIGAGLLQSPNWSYDLSPTQFSAKFRTPG
jgi:sarcosine oxidase